MHTTGSRRVAPGRIESLKVRNFRALWSGLRKREAARTVAAYIDPHCNRSHSFVKFRNALIEATA